VEFRILGLLEVVDDGRVLELGTRKQRALLMLLLLRHGELVPVDELIEDLWSDPPRTAETTLRAYVSRLRAIIGADRLQSGPRGYRLRVDPGELDAERFEDMVSAGQSEEALALWRGPALADVAYESFAQAEIARLEELRVAAVEDRVEHDLARGRHGQLVAELEWLVSRHPLHERLRAQLMLALYRSGRQAEALEVYNEGRRLLTDELGLEPGAELAELQRAILQHDPRLDPIRLERNRPEPAGGFVGRHDELALLNGAFDDAVAGRGGLVLISGEPGIGKSRLVEQLGAAAERQGALMVVGRAWEAGGAPPYWPWVQALRSYLRSTGAQPGPELAQILPELGAEPPQVEPEVARFRLFDAIASFLRDGAATRPVVLALDDLHAADTSSLMLLRFLAHALADGRVLVLAAYRDVDPMLADPLAETVAELSRGPNTRMVALGGLREAEVAAYIEATAGYEPPGVAAAIHRETEGNPLFVGEIVRLLVTEEALDQAATAWRVTVPEGVRAVIRRRLRHLSDDCKLVLVLASVLGREFRLDALEIVSGVTRETLLERLDEAAAARVVGEVPGAAGRLRFSHALIRDSLYDELTPGRRALLERRIGEALEALYEGDPEPYLTELAHHFLAAVPTGVADKALFYARRAGDRALRQLAFEEAARLYESALSVADDDGTRCELLLAMGDAQTRAGDTPAAKVTYRDAADLAETLGLPEQLARAALGYGGRFVWDVSRDDPSLLPLLEEALESLGDRNDALRARLLARVAGGPLRDSRYPASRREAVSEEGLAIARRVGDPATLAYVLSGYIAAHHSPKHTPAAVAWATELIEVATVAGDEERALEGYEHRHDFRIELGDIDGASADLDAMTQSASEIRQPAQFWMLAECRAQRALLAGRLDEAEEFIEEAFVLGRRAQRWNATASYLLQLFVLRRLQGRLGEIMPVLRGSIAEYASYPIVHCALAFAMQSTGDEAEARSRLDELAGDRFSAVAFDEGWLCSLCLLAEVAAAVGERAHCAVLYELLEPFADRIACSYSEISTGAVSGYLGLLAAALDRPADAGRHFEEAIALNTRVGAEPWAALARDGAARLAVRG
jgi:DNA-binding SARP family transcriptional activator/tetratricopeptide (TPR) repeat protein